MTAHKNAAACIRSVAACRSKGNQSSFSAMILREISRAGLDPSDLTFEIVDAIAVAHPEIRGDVVTFFNEIFSELTSEWRIVWRMLWEN